MYIELVFFHSNVEQVRSPESIHHVHCLAVVSCQKYYSKNQGIILLTPELGLISMKSGMQTACLQRPLGDRIEGKISKFALDNCSLQSFQMSVLTPLLSLISTCTQEIPV